MVVKTHFSKFLPPCLYHSRFSRAHQIPVRVSMPEECPIARKDWRILFDWDFRASGVPFSEHSHWYSDMTGTLNWLSRAHLIKAMLISLVFCKFRLTEFRICSTMSWLKASGKAENADSIPVIKSSPLGSALFPLQWGRKWLQLQPRFCHNEYKLWLLWAFALHMTVPGHPGLLQDRSKKKTAPVCFFDYRFYEMFYISIEIVLI